MNGRVITIISLLASYDIKLTLYCFLAGLIVLTAVAVMKLDSHLIYGSPGHHKHSNRNNVLKFSQSFPSIAICCGWGNKMASGQLTYSISGGSASSRQAVVDAMNEWASKINVLQLKQIFNDKDSDISVSFETGGAQTSSHSKGIGSIIGSGHIFSEILGETKITPKDGLIDKAHIILATTGFGSSLGAAQIRQIAEHEIGHALGLSHANFAGDIMAPAVNYQSGAVSKCDITAVLMANNWKLEGGSSAAHPPNTNRIACS